MQSPMPMPPFPFVAPPGAFLVDACDEHKKTPPSGPEGYMTCAVCRERIEQALRARAEESERERLRQEYHRSIATVAVPILIGLVQKELVREMREKGATPLQQQVDDALIMARMFVDGLETLEPSKRFAEHHRQPMPQILPFDPPAPVPVPVPSAQDTQQDLATSKQESPEGEKKP